MRGQGKGIEDLKDESPFKAKKYTVVKQWSFEDSKFKRVARPDIYKSSMVSCGLPGDNPVPVPLAPDPDRSYTRNSLSPGALANSPFATSPPLPERSCDDRPSRSTTSS